MTERKDFIKIRTNILIDPNKHFTFENGSLTWNKEYLEEFYNADAKYRDPIIEFINEAVGLHNWAIRFQPFYTGQYEVYIYCDSDDAFHKIVSIIHERLKGEEFRLFARRGTVNDYIEGR